MSYDYKKIKSMNYTEFVGFINQWNVLPGAHDTLSKWAIFSKMDKNSKILEIACTTGFSSRELALYTGCSGLGLDICKKSIDAAKVNKLLYAPEINIDYLHQDGLDFVSKEKFSHLVIGASLKFFDKPQKMIDKCNELLIDGGYLLASPFFIKKPIPKSLIKKFEKVFGITPTVESYKDIMAMYRGFEIIFQERNDLIEETEEELNHYCQSTIEKAKKEKNIDDNVAKEAYKRLYEIKKMSNELRSYQSYIILVLRYRSFIYPNRYVELF